MGRRRTDGSIAFVQRPTRPPGFGRLPGELEGPLMRRIGIDRRSRWVAVVLFAIGIIAAAGESATADSESWDAIFLAGSKIGYMRIRVAPVKDGDRQFNRVLVDFNLSFKRGNNFSTMEMQYGTIETPEGQVLRLDTRTLASQQVMRVHGDVIDGKMKLKIENGAQKQEQILDWTPDTYGPYGAEMSLSHKPMKEGETRTVKAFIPLMNKIGLMTLTAKAKEQVPLGEGVNRELLRIDQEVAFEDGKKAPEMNTTLWVDEAGQILRSFTDSNGGMMTYRTTREYAMRQMPKVDLIQASIVKIGYKISNPENSRDILYKVTLNDSPPSEVFPNDRRQSIRPGPDSRSAFLEIKTAGPDAGQPGPETVAPEFTRSNPFITSDDPRVITLSKRAVVGASNDPWAKAQAINKWVSKNLSNKNFETSFAPADEVARTLSGDCTEHGVLTAAMCRAQGIPARVVTGLVYANHLGGFGFHMWNEVYVNRRWVAIDSAFDQDQVDAVHIKLSDSSLDGVAPFETFLTVSRVFGKLKLETVEIR